MNIDKIKIYERLQKPRCRSVLEGRLYYSVYFMKNANKCSKGIC